MKVRKILIVAGAGVFLFYVIAAPYQASEAVNAILSWLKDSAEAIISFIQNVVT